MTITFYPLDISYLIEGNTAYILLFGRNEAGERLCVKIPFQPYIWILHRESERKEDMLAQLRQDTTVTITALTEEELEENGKKKRVFKLTLPTPDLVVSLRNVLKEKNITFAEADILFVRRFLIDNDINFFDEYLVEGEPTAPLPRAPCILAHHIERGEKSYESRLKILALDIETYPDE